MRYLLDTCVLLWTLDGNRAKLGSLADTIQNPQSVIVVSVVSHWEITIKASLGKLKMERDLEESVIQCGFIWLPITCSHIQALAQLPHHHNDPFDRLLIAQARAEALTLLTHDTAIQQYGSFK